MAHTIKTETKVGGNTADRVGSAFEGVADALDGTEQIAEMDKAVQEVQQQVDASKAQIQSLVNALPVVQQTGDSTTSVMSQKAVSDKLAKKADTEQVNNSLYNLEKKIGDRVVVNGNVTNLPDDEDIASVDNKLKLKDREVDVANFQSKGYVILRKNLRLVNGVVKNVLTQNMINQPNTIYEIKYDFDINGGLISLPENVSLIFNGGSFSNGVVEPKNCCIYSKFKSPIFIDIVFKKNGNYVIGNELYDYYFKDTNRDDDYLVLYNLVFGNPAIITAPVLNIKTFINPYYEQYKQYGVMQRITTTILNLEGNNSVINILADLDTKERPFTSIDKWGINTPALISANAQTLAVHVRNVTFIDDKSINGYGADFTKTIYSYNGQEKNVRGWLINASFDKLEKLVFENVNARTACELFGTNSHGNSKSYINVLFNNVNVYSHTNFCIEIWGNDIGAASVVYNNSTFEIYYGATCLISNSALENTYAIYRNCTFKNGCLSEVGSYRCENCLFYNAQYIYTTTDIKIEIINCTFEIDKKIKTVKGAYFDLFSKDCLIKDSKFNIHKLDYATLRIINLSDKGNITTNKVTAINTNIPITAGASISDEYIKSLDFTFINMWKEDPLFNSTNSGFVSNILKIKGIFYNCGFVFDRALPELRFDRNKDYLSWLSTYYPVIYKDNIEDTSKIVLNDLVVYSKKTLTINFNGEILFDKYLTIKLGVINSGNGSIKVYTTSGNTISVNIDKYHMSININNEIAHLNFPSVKYRDLSISFNLEKLFVYPFVDGNYVMLSNLIGSMTKNSIQLNGNFDININGAGFKYMIFQPIMLYKNVF